MISKREKTVKVKIKNMKSQTVIAFEESQIEKVKKEEEEEVKKY